MRKYDKYLRLNPSTAVRSHQIINVKWSDNVHDNSVFVEYVRFITRSDIEMHVVGVRITLFFQHSYSNVFLQSHIDESVQ